MRVDYRRPMLTALPLRATQIAKRDLFTPSYILIRRPCDSSLSSRLVRPTQESYHDSLSIDGRPGVLEARNIAKTLQIPYELEDPCFPTMVPHISKGHGPHIIQGTSTDSVLLRKASTWDAPRRRGVVFQPLSLIAFNIEEMSHFGRVIPYIRGLLLWPCTT
ncbi:hypothetical protein CK203_102352 [Vitis vinifera]|uniref:Uncharacterized protein n=1 Tax=Vitis vinifera TaxID=29760 RepID=A0A438BR19_VITVI|nr:hypothetical protein CK203_102352 [Vitis vinifera]